MSAGIGRELNPVQRNLFVEFGLERRVGVTVDKGG